MAKCNQCDKPAVMGGLCVDHYFKLQQAIYLQFSMVAAQFNVTQEYISAGTGGLMPPKRIIIPPPPSLGDNYIFNNINVTESNIGAINTGTAANIDASITIMQNQGNNDLAAAITELTQAIIDSKEIEQSTKNEIAEQLQFLVAQATAEPKIRSLGLVKGILTGIRNTISVAAGLLAIWDKVEPLIRMYLGIG